MSMHRYPSSPEYKSEDGDVISIIMHGGGTSRWNARARVTITLQKYSSVVYSVLLPYHGENSAQHYPREGRHDDLVRQGVEKIREALRPLVKAKKVIMLGMSFGALHLIRCFRALYPSMHPSSIFIGIGSMLVPSVAETKFIDKWWSGTRDDPEREPERESMRKLHTNIDNMLSFIVDGAARPDSPIYHTPEEVLQLQSEKCYQKMFFIHAREDEPYPLKRLVEYVKDDHLTIVEDCGHFGYFNPNVGWPQVEQAIKRIVTENIAQNHSHDQSSNQSTSHSITQQLKSKL